nr:hypothetical protein [Clostridium paridis]
MIDENIKLDGLSAKEVWEALYNKELNSKKSILEYIELTKVLKKDNVDSKQIQETYNFIYDSIEKMGDAIKVNTNLYLKNQLKAQLGKYVKNIDPKPVNYFIEFFKEAYPPHERKKDFTWVLMDINKITEEQIWTTLTYINSGCIKGNKLSHNQIKDTIEMVEKLIDKNNIKYVNRVKSLEKLLNVLGIKIVNVNDRFKVRRIFR